MKFTTAQLEECAAGSMTMTEAARHLGVTRAAVSARVQKLRAEGLDIIMAKRGMALSEEDMQQAEKDNLSAAEVAVLYGVHRSTVASAAKRRNVSLHRHNAPADDCVQRGFTIPRCVAEALDERAKVERRSRSWTVATALEMYLEEK